jgi:RNA polymerase sigma-70 factor (sigma-E family)
MRGRDSQGGDDFSRFVAESSAGLIRAALLVTYNLHDAEDLVQEALFRTAKRWPQVRRMEHPFAYTRKIVVNLALRSAGERTTMQSALDLGHCLDRADGDANGWLEAIDERDELIQRMGSLTPRQRAVVVLRYLEDLSEVEVAELLGWPIGSVKSTTARAIERLRSGSRFSEAKNRRNAPGSTDRNGSRAGEEEASDDVVL